MENFSFNVKHLKRDEINHAMTMKLEVFDSIVIIKQTKFF